MQPSKRQQTTMTFIRYCDWCSTAFETEHDTKAYCTRQHKERAHHYRKGLREGRNYKPEFSRLCKGCAIPYTTKKSNKLYCSTECQSFYREQARRERDRLYRNAKTPAFKARIYFKSNGKCGICQEPIDTTLAWPDPLSLSLDHIIPRSLGGTHSASNLQAAHLQCNAKRGNRPL